MKKMNPVSFSQQQGSGLVMLIVALFFGSLLLLAIKLGPAYMDDFTIREALQGLEGTEGLARMGAPEVRRRIGDRLSVNNIRGFDVRQIGVEKNGDFVVISLDYEVRNNLFGNVDTVVRFQHEYELTGQ